MSNYMKSARKHLRNWFFLTVTKNKKLNKNPNVTDINVFTDVAQNSRYAGIETQCFFYAALEVFEFRKVLRSAWPVRVAKHFVHLLVNQLLQAMEFKINHKSVQLIHRRLNVIAVDDEWKEGDRCALYLFFRMSGHAVEEPSHGRGCRVVALAKQKPVS